VIGPREHDTSVLYARTVSAKMKSQRLTVDTVPLWHSDLIAMLTAGAA